MRFLSVTSFLFLAPFATAQLSGSVGPTTSLSSKSTLCNVLDYGGSVGSSDIGPAIQKAFDVRSVLKSCDYVRGIYFPLAPQDCVKTNSKPSTLYVPSGACVLNKIVNVYLTAGI